MLCSLCIDNNILTTSSKTITLIKPCGQKGKIKFVCIFCRREIGQQTKEFQTWKYVTIRKNTERGMERKYKFQERKRTWNEVADICVSRRLWASVVIAFTHHEVRVNWWFTTFITSALRVHWRQHPFNKLKLWWKQFRYWIYKIKLNT